MRKTFLLLVLTFFICNAELFAKDISAYLIGDYIAKKQAEKKLTNAGFKIVASYKSIKNGETLIFTNDALIKEGSKPGRAYASILRLYIDTKEKKISFTNPLYFGKAFMQDDYNKEVFLTQYKAINNEFQGLKASIDTLDEDDISSYHFMIGMPYYEDYDELGEDSHANLLAKVRAYKKGKRIVFELKLSDNSTLIGYDLAKRTKKFVKKIGRANGGVLPYCISIEKGKATSLEAKYYLALSYPLLSMTQFTRIATVPGAIKKDLKKSFK